MGLINQTDEQYYLGPDGVWNSFDENYGDYQFVAIKDIINNFIISNVGESKLISKLKRSDVAFHAQRGLQELSFDVLPSFKSFEIEIPPTLYMILPKDYVNYVKLSWVDDQGIERILYPTSKTSNPSSILQDSQYEYLFDDQDGEKLLAVESETLKKFRENNFTQRDINGSDYDLLNIHNYGRRYGIDPQYAQSNGVFFIDRAKGIIHFGSSMVGKIVTLKYISDGVGTDQEMVVHKFAEQALYNYIAHAVLSTRSNIPEYIVQRYKKELRASKRNARLRLSNIKIEEITQTLRGKSKQIKH